VIFRAAPLIFLGDRSPGTVAATNPLDEGGALRVPKKASLNGLEPSARLIIWSLAPSKRVRFASIPTRGRKGAWHRVGGGWGGWFASIQAGRSRCLAPGAWTRFASIPILGSQWCLTPSWDVRFASIRARSHQVPGTGLGGWFASIQAGRSRCQAPGAWTRFASIPILGSQWCLAPGAWTRFASIPILGSQWCLALSWAVVPQTQRDWGLS
jgi:hypothetical protein